MIATFLNKTHSSTLSRKGFVSLKHANLKSLSWIFPALWRSLKFWIVAHSQLKLFPLIFRLVRLGRWFVSFPISSKWLFVRSNVVRFLKLNTKSSKTEESSWVFFKSRYLIELYWELENALSFKWKMQEVLDALYIKIFNLPLALDNILFGHVLPFSKQSSVHLMACKFTAGSKKPVQKIIIWYYVTKAVKWFGNL